MKKDTASLLPMPIKVKPYTHQVAAFNFVCGLFGLVSTGGDSDDEGHGEMCPVRESIPEVGKSNP